MIVLIITDCEGSHFTSETYFSMESRAIIFFSLQQNVSSTTSLPQASPKERKDITSAILSKSNMAR